MTPVEDSGESDAEPDGRQAAGSSAHHGLTWGDLARLTVDDLSGPPAQAQDPQQADNLAERLRETAVDKAKQQNDLREQFFTWASRVAAWTLAGNFAVFGFYMWSEWGEIDRAVMLAWISATIVEVLGISYIVARYLFEDAPTSDDESGAGSDR